MGQSANHVEFFKSPKFAVVGASTDRSKFGNKVFRWYLEHDLPVTPINPTAPIVEEHETKPNLSALSSPADTSVSIITPPKVTRGIIEEAASLGIKHVWLQPGAESSEAVQLAREKGINIISGGACILVSGAAAKEAASKL